VSETNAIIIGQKRKLLYQEKRERGSDENNTFWKLMKIILNCIVALVWFRCNLDIILGNILKFRVSYIFGFSKLKVKIENY